MDVEFMQQRVAILTKLNIVQEAPRVRTIRTHDGFMRLSFPWVTIGYGSLLTRVAGNRFMFGCFHHRPWTDLYDAASVLSRGERYLHFLQQGICCVGWTAFEAVLLGQMTPSEAVWNTYAEFTTEIIQRYVHPEMLDIKNPKKILDVRYPIINWGAWSAS